MQTITEEIKLVYPDFEDEEIEFNPCDHCDGHQACEDFGCAFQLGIGHLVKTKQP